MFRFGLFALLLTPLFVLLGSGCIGLKYQAGAKSLFGADIQTVSVPMFEADPTRRHLAERLTEAVCKRIEERSSYKVVSRASADSVLQGTINTVRQGVALVDNFNDSRQKFNTLAVQIKWKDRRDTELRAETFSFGESSATISGADYMVAEFGHSQLTSEQDQIDKIADQIVGMMESPW